MSNGSQFFITMEDIPDISGVFSAFGQVIEGLNVAAQIAEGDTIEQIVITEAAASQAPTPGPLPTATTVPTPYAPDQSKTGDRPLAKLPAEQRNGMFNAEPAMQLEFGRDYVARITTDVGDIVVNCRGPGAQDGQQLRLPGPPGFLRQHNLPPHIRTSWSRPATHRHRPADRATASTTRSTRATYDGPGIVAMANAGPNTNGSQFFITYARHPWLNGQHTLFGKVSEGMDVLTQLSCAIRKWQPNQHDDRDNHHRDQVAVNSTELLRRFSITNSQLSQSTVLCSETICPVMERLNSVNALAEKTLVESGA